MTGIVYKNTALSILEASFILNMLILSGWTIYNRHASNRDSSDGQTALVCTSSGVAFSTFICISYLLPYLPLPQVQKAAPTFKIKKNREGRQKDEWSSRRVCGVCCWCSTSPSSYKDCDRAERTTAHGQLKSWQLIVSWLQNMNLLHNKLNCNQKYNLCYLLIVCYIPMQLIMCVILSNVATV